MNICPALLRDCIPENLARLARSLRVDLPPIPQDSLDVLRWRRRAAHLIADAIDDDRWNAARAAMEAEC